MYVWLQRRFLNQRGGVVNISEHEYEKKMVQIVEQMEYLMMDVILRCIKKLIRKISLLAKYRILNWKNDWKTGGMKTIFKVSVKRSQDILGRKPDKG